MCPTACRSKGRRGGSAPDSDANDDDDKVSSLIGEDAEDDTIFADELDTFSRIEDCTPEIRSIGCLCRREGWVQASPEGSATSDCSCQVIGEPTARSSRSYLRFRFQCPFCVPRAGTVRIYPRQRTGRLPGYDMLGKFRSRTRAETTGSGIGFRPERSISTSNQHPSPL